MKLMLKNANFFFLKNTIFSPPSESENLSHYFGDRHSSYSDQHANY